ncbi:hypothetical protein LSUE1_G007116 [Lachnellula suecica]|uniref:Zn(2)-C6 fungal-type domain-containing protein n=1 Tax=Lachnellula suecica TaxID=602035 RepID=A0A8T9BVU7_9HELO|nr:hypothetical protein LSUE1_G007116 [Lachnellula suecica]
MDDSQFFLDPALWFDPSLPLTDFTPSPGLNASLISANILSTRKARIRASRACIACRSRHMKCDSVEPKCTRCQVDSRTCVYTKSRRGGSSRPLVPLTGLSMPKDRLANVSLGATDSPQAPDSIFSDDSPKENTHSEATSIDTRDRLGTDQLLESYYDFFHDAHPIALPRKKLISQLHTDPGSLDYLFPVLEYIGSLYTSTIDSDVFRNIAHEKLYSNNLPSTGFSVQALLLFSLAIHCSDEYKAAEGYLNQAIDIALSINMHQEAFSESNSDGDAILAESWRRTWWTLYGTDGLFAAISHYPMHRLRDTMGDVKLPCEDREYERGKIPQPRSLADYDNREFDDEDIVYSSFTYLIDSLRICSAVLTINMEERGPGERTLAAADAKFVNWTLYLPKCKQELVGKDQRVDETMFLAHIVMNCEKMLVHRPHSQLLYSDIETKSICTPPSSLRQTRALQKRIEMHTAKALEAIEASIMLFALPSPHIKHSPIVTCALALAVMAQVSSCNHVLKEGSEVYLASRDRIRLGLGALKAQVGTWGMAKRSVREVASVARELLSIPTVANVVETLNVVSYEEMLSDEALVLVDSGEGNGHDLQYERFTATD